MALDCRTASLRALARRLQQLVWQCDGETRQFARGQVFDSFPSADDEFVPPSASLVQVEGLIDYAGFTAATAFEVLRTTGSSVVYKLGEWQGQVDLHLKGRTPDEINAMVRAVQDVLNDPDSGRIGLFLDLGDSYFDQVARVTYEEDRADVTEERAFRGDRETVVPLQVEVSYCREVKRPEMKPERQLELQEV